MCERGRSLFMPVHGRHGAECTQRRLRTPPGPPLDRLHRQTVVQDPIHPILRLFVLLFSLCSSLFPSRCLSVPLVRLFRLPVNAQELEANFTEEELTPLNPFNRDKTRKKERGRESKTEVITVSHCIYGSSMISFVI